VANALLQDDYTVPWID